MELDETQLQAVEMVMQRSISGVTGPAGCGKSTILKEVAVRCRALGAAALFVCFTGTAVQVVKSHVPDEVCMTIDMVICTPAIVAKFQRGTVIIDEASMVTQELFYSVMENLRPTRLALFGDINQLQPIGCSGIMRDLFAFPKFCKTVLTKVYRQNANSALYRNLCRICAGQVSELEQDASFSIANLAGYVPARGVQVVCLNNEGANSVEDINRKMQSNLNPYGQPLPGKSTLRIGDPVICTANVYCAQSGELLASNGAIGTLKNEGDVPQIHYRSGFVDLYDFTKRRFKTPAFALAYAITVDKTQGSQFPHVVFIADDARRRLDRELFYTAISRATESCTLVIRDAAIISRATRVVEYRPGTLYQDLEICI